MPNAAEITELQHKAFAAAYCDERYAAFPALATTMPGLSKPELVVLAVNGGALRIYGFSIKGEILDLKKELPLSTVTDFIVDYRFPYIGGRMSFSTGEDRYVFRKFGKIGREADVMRSEIAQ